MRKLGFVCAFVLLVVGASLSGVEIAKAYTSGCINYDVVPGTHNWKFRNLCPSRVEIAYCVRYNGDTSTHYISRFQFNRGATLTVYLQPRPNRIVFNYIETRSGQAAIPGC